MQCNANTPPTDSCSEYDPNSDSELEGDLSQCSSLVEESEEDALSYSPIKVLALTFQGYIARTYGVCEYALPIHF
jgi:hypothetical protein